jgi:uncharacterized protein YfdQ (DUF2303 family)
MSEFSPSDPSANPTTDATVVRDLAFQADEPTLLAAGEVYAFPTNPHQIDAEFLLDNPRRKRGATTLHDQDSFAKFVTIHKDDSTLVFADKDYFRLEAVFNAAVVTPGWADHRAVFALRHTEAWKRWAANDGKLLDQESFAEHIEDSVEDIFDPAGAFMLEIAQTFHAKTGVNFKQAIVLASGQRQFVYEETTTAKAGQTGDVTVPDMLTLGMAPFEGGQPCKVMARLRFRMREGGLAIGYKLVRPKDVLDAAFVDICEWVATDTGKNVLKGKP